MHETHCTSLTLRRLPAPAPNPAATSVEGPAPASLEGRRCRRITILSTVVRHISTVGSKGSYRRGDWLPGERCFRSCHNLSVCQVENRCCRYRLPPKWWASFSECRTTHEGNVKNNIQEFRHRGPADANHSSSIRNGHLARLGNIHNPVSEVEVLVSKPVLGVLRTHKPVTRNTVQPLRFRRQLAELEIVRFLRQLHDDVGIELLGIQWYPIHRAGL